MLKIVWKISEDSLLKVPHYKFLFSFHNNEYNMIYISAQPDDFYFIWQLELQIRNFSSLGIAKEDYHILIGVDPHKGLSMEFRNMMKQYATLASFYIYNDTRKSKNYIPSLRPHIIKKHFTKYPDLKECNIFYHDSDILLRTLPVNGSMLADDTSYVSDTRSYLDSKYVIAKGGEEALEIMCSITGITVQQAIEHDAHCGGAQYLLKHVDEKFWGKIEKRSELIYTALRDINTKRNNEMFASTGTNFSKYVGIQEWCADMWAINYTMIEEKRKVRIAQSMRFCWADSPIAEWDKCTILHYTGNQKHERPIFKKSDYLQYHPLCDFGLKNISSTACGIKVVEQIFQLRDSCPRCNLMDTLFIIDWNNNTTLVVEFMILHFHTQILIVVDEENLSSYSNTFSHLSDKVTLCSYKEEVQTVEYFKAKGVKYVVQYIPNLIIHPRILKSVLTGIRKCGKEAIAVNSQYFVVDKLMTRMFQKMKDIELLYSNKGKFIVSQGCKCIECYTICAYLKGDTPYNDKAISGKLMNGCFVLF